ncbi:RHS repeat-associated core domain-containing protein [Kribbella jejuensis]|uniref:RHS repeat-associated protein n=1 Tax=Kribbella jejuensis TaxID=236068 RepID=A0A542EQW6_9ACTN|nr:RHS repeat-associated core domain-containing protein [Kribbella jejuensis]TQJ17751.1 RHS repeat-associated protein [Kribbella jejuensis]
MSGKGEAKAPVQKLGAGKLPKPIAPGQNKVKPPSLRDMFPVTGPKPVNAATEQPAPKPAEPVPSKPLQVKGFNKQTSRELPEKRDRFSQTFANVDGTETSVLSPAPLNFQKADGSWEEINANLQPRDGGGWETISTEIYSWIAAQANADPVAGVELGGGHNIDWGLSGAAAVAGQVAGSKVSFADALPSTDLELDSQPRGIKETIVLKAATAPRSFVFPLNLSDNLTASLSGRDVVLTDEHGTERARIPGATMEDSNTVEVAATSNAVSYELVTVDGRQALKVTADSTWLDDPARVFPVRIDPTVIPTDRVTPNYAVSAGVNGSVSGASELQVGCRPAAGTTNCSSTSGWDAYTSLLSFPSLVDAFRYDTIVAAQLEVYNYQADTCSSRQLDVYGAMEGWQSTPLPSLKYPGPQVTPSVIASKSFSRGYVSGTTGTTACQPMYDALPFNSVGVSWLQSLVDGQRSNFGFALFANQRTDRYSWKKLAGISTANPPKLAVTHSPYHAAYAFRAQPPEDYVTQDKAGKFPMTITNLGDFTWQPGDDFMSYRIYKNGQLQNWAVLNTPVTASVPHGGKINLDVAVNPLPGTADGVDYQLEFSMVHRDTSVYRWYTDWGVLPAARLITIQNVPPVVDLSKVWPLNGAQANSLTPQVWAAGIDPDAPESTLKYSFRVCEVVGDNPLVGCFFSGDYTSSKTWIVPAGKLAWNRQYQWQIYVQDNDGQHTIGSPITMFTDVPQPAITSHISNNDGKSQDKPYDPAVGNYTASALDVVVPVAGPELNVARTYNSLDPRRTGLFGAGWSSRYDMQLVIENDGNALVTYPDGRQVRFGANADGTFAAPRGAKTTLVATSANGPWTLQIVPGTKYEFAAGTGKLSKIYATQGQPLVMAYRADGTLESAASLGGAGRKLSFTWTADNKHVASVSTQPVNGSPLTWTYEYSGDVLTKSCDAEQKCTSYGSTQGSHYRSTVLDSRPDGYFRLSDDGSDANATNEIDIALNDGFGTYSGVQFGQSSPLAAVGDADKSVSFAGAGRVGLPNGLATRSRDEAVELWFKTSGSTSQPLLGYQKESWGKPTTGGMPVLYVGADGKLRGQFWHGSAAPMTSAGLVNDNQWHHVVLSSMGTRQSLYLDGAAIGTITQSVVDHAQFPANQIGAAVAAAPTAWPSYGTQAVKYFTGQIDEVAMYSHPLTTRDVVAHWQLGHNAADQLSSITSAGGRTTAQIEYNPANDRVQTYVDENGGSWTIGTPQLTGANLLRDVQVTGPGPTSYMYEYDALGGWLVRTGRPLGEDTHQPWTADTTPDWISLKGYGVRSYTHDPTGQLTKVTSETGGEVSMKYDDRGNVTQTTTCRGAGGTDCHTAYNTYFANDSWPALDPRWDKLWETRDGRSSGPTDDTYKVNRNLTVSGDVASEFSPNGGLKTYTYTDGVQTGPDGQPMPPGLLKTESVKVNASTTAVTQYLYDQYGDLVQTTAPSGLVTKYTYDEIGRKKTEAQVSDTYPNGVTTTYDYDKMSRVVAVTGPVTTDAVTGEQHQQKAELEYDADGNVTKTTARDLKTSDDPRVTTMTYDDRNRLSSTVDADGKESQQGYDEFGNRTWSEDANGNRFEYKYSDLNMPTEVWDMNLPADPNNPPTDGPREGIDYAVRSKTQYDPSGRKVAEVDAMGRVVTYDYNLDDTLKTKTLKDFHNPDGSTRLYVLEDDTYDGAGNRISAKTDNRMTTTTYTIDAAGRVSSQTVDPTGLKRATTYDHDLAGNVTRETNTGNWSNATVAGPTTVTDATDYVFDAAGRRVSQTVENTSGGTATNMTTSWTYDQRGLATSMTTPRGNASGAVKADFTTTYVNDELGRMVKTVAAKVKAEQDGGTPADVQPTAAVGYGAFGQVTSSKDALGSVTKSAFDKLGRTTEVTAPTYTPPGGTAVTPKTSFSYDAVGNLLQQVDERGNTTNFTYDHLNQQVQVDAPGTTNTERAVTKIAYTANGDVASTTDPLGAVKQYTYDDLDRVVTSTDVERKPTAANFVTRLAYDDMDNVVSAQSPSGAVALSSYDSLGQLIKSTDPNNVVTQLGYDYAGRQVVSSDAMNRSSVATYDQAGQLVASKTLNASGVSLGTTALGYDLDGNLTSSTPASGNRATTYTYDALGRLITQTDPVSATDQVNVSYGYDAAGNRTRYTDGRGNSTVYTVNTLGLPEKVIEPSTTAHPALADRTWTASYDAAGNAVSLLSPGGVTRTRVFDAAGRLQTETGANAEAPTAARNLTYDLDGRLATSSALDGVNTYTYNDRGMLLRADGPSGTSTQGYDPDGQLTQRIDAAGTADFTYVNGRPATVTDPVTRVLQTLGYNAAGQLASIDYGSGRVRTIGYDPYGRMNSDVLKAGTTSVTSITYGYDADNNITSKNTTGVSGAGNNTYVYDQLGRLTSWTKGTSTTTYGWDADSNRTKVTTSAGTKLASYDERNRLLDDGTSTYTYSPRGALLTQTTGATTEAFSFDAFDRMITRSARDFTYDALDRPVQAGTARMRYDGFSDEVVSDGTQFFGRSASDGLLAVGYDTTKRLVLADRHGDVFAGFDPTDTTLTAGLPDSRTYDPFGNSTSAAGLKYRVGYQGDWTDPRSGDVNEGARWYNPGTGTFNSRDTINVDGGAASSVLNLYAYAGGNPLTLNDPDGHSSVDPGDGGGNCYMKTIGWKGPEIPIQVMVCVKPCTLTNTCQQKPPPVTPPTGECKGKGCDPGCKKSCDPGCKKSCDPGCKSKCDPSCKTTKCGPKPPPPPTCDAQCQLKKKIQKEKDELEQDAKTVKQPPPGNPVCATGNPLCPSDPSQPATVVTSGGDLTDETTAWSDQQYKNALNAAGSVIDASSTGTYNWFDTDFKEPQGGGGTSGGVGGGYGVGVGVGAGLGGIIPPEVLAVVGGLLGIASALAQNTTDGGGGEDKSGAAAQPPNGCEPGKSDDCVNIYKAPSKGMTDKLVREGFDPKDFPGSGNGYPDGKAYFGVHDQGKEIAFDYSTRGGYDLTVIRVSIPRADFDQYFSKYVQNYDGLENGQIAVPKEEFERLNQYPRSVVGR